MAELKTGFVALIGRPNVGKSTLMNRLIGQKIAITSNKPQTTRNRIQTVYTEERGQIIFLDTPGIHKAKNKLGEYMVNAAKQTMNDVDVVLWQINYGFASAMSWIYFIIVIAIIGVTSLIISKGVYYYD